MLIIVILSFLVLLCFGLVIYAKHNKKDDYDVPLVPGLMVTIVLFFVVIFSIMTNTTDHAKEVRYETQMKITEFNRKYNKLTKINANKEEVKFYNEEVKEFRKNLLEKQENLKNPWINCFTCYVYKEFNVEEIKIISYTINTSK